MSVLELRSPFLGVEAGTDIPGAGIGSRLDEHFAPDSDCRKVRTVLDRVGEKWSILTIRMLDERPYRFNELRRALDGITQRMLTLTLRSLERDGLITRTATSTIPPRVDYDLTTLGRSLRQPIDELTTWALDHHAAIVASRESYDAVESHRTTPSIGGGAGSTLDGIAAA